jgi:hypothetical protein
VTTDPARHALELVPVVIADDERRRRLDVAFAAVLAEMAELAGDGADLADDRATRMADQERAP